MQIHQSDENSSVRWKFISEMKVCLLDENLSMTRINYHTAEDSSISSMRSKFMHLIEIQHLNESLTLRWKITNH